ncbi:hypothetical protein BH09PAT2_BH09PAT2_10500 [soil metagenome]
MFHRRPSGGGFNSRTSSFGRRSSSRRGAPSSSIHESKYIKKAIGLAEEAPFIPQTAFADLPVNDHLKANISRAGFVTPTPIQDASILPIMSGKNLIGIANTGTGKTAAFLIPLIEKIVKDKNQRVIILVPTRELAVQIQSQMRSLTQSMNIYSALCIGGSFMRDQIHDLRRNPQFVIGTPGRIKDFVNRRILNLATFNNVVLDEVDRMLDMGFIADIKYLMAQFPVQRQSLFFSATISPPIHALIQNFVPDPVMVSVKKQETVNNVDQDVVRVQAGMQKMDVLEDLLKKEEFKKVIIFGRTKHGVERLSLNLFKKGFKVASIHGDKTQSKRNYAIRLFKDNVVSILVATDVASRGIDIADITHVINFDQPATYDDYVHRIGRTGRANKKGVALTFLD